MNKNLLNKNLLKHILIPGIGFGIGGIIWGFSIYQSILAEENFPIFSYFSGIITLMIFGSISLILISFSKDIKKILKIFFCGTAGFFIGYILGIVIIYPAGLLGWLFLTLAIPLEIIESLVTLEPDLIIGNFFLVFALIGAIVGAFYAFALKIKVLSLTKYGAIGFALGSLIGPMIGNGILNLFGSLFLTYITTFFIICAFLGMFLGLGIYKSSILKALDKKL